jgi:uncharacterized membrane protein YbhN (UPF0104 family)
MSGALRRLRGAVRLVLGLALLAFLLSRVDLDSLTDSLGMASLRPALFALLLVFVGHLAAAVRLSLFSRALGLGSSIRRLLGVNLTAAFYAIFAPGGNVTAGGVRVIRMSVSREDVAPAIHAIVRDRLDATMALVLVGLAFSLADGSGHAMVTLGFVVCSLLGIGVWMTATILARKAPSEPDEPLPAGGAIGRVWRRTQRSFVAAARVPQSVQLRAFGLSLFAQLLGTLAYWVLADALDVGLSIASLGWVRAAVMLATMVPISTAGIGVREAAFLLLLKPFGMDDSLVIGFSFLVFGVTVLTPGLMGGLVEAVWNVRGGVSDLGRTTKPAIPDDGGKARS